MKKKAKDRPKDGKSRQENLNTQPHVVQRVFNNADVLTQGWFPVCKSTELKRGSACSFKIFKQRLVFYRGESGQVYALDAFCPHLGADLGNGRVVGEQIQCYFHQWELNAQGQVAKIACRPSLDASFRKTCNRAYPVREAYGHIWVFSAPEASHELVKPAGFENAELSALFVKEITLFAHHHVMMANATDLQHFATVHKVDIAFDYQVDDSEAGIFTWTFRGSISESTLKGRLARRLLGPEYEYRVKFAGGSIVTISYGSDQYLWGRKLPSLQVLWGALPQENGISKVRIFFVTQKRPGLLGKLTNGLLYFLTGLMLAMLRDEDIEAFPNMRFNTHRLIKEDASLARFIQLTNKLDLSDWGELPSPS